MKRAETSDKQRCKMTVETLRTSDAQAARLCAMFRPKGSRPSRRVSHKGSNMGNDEHILASKLQKGFSYAEISQLTRASRKQCPTRGVLIHWAVKMTTKAPRASLTHIAIKQTAQNLGKLQRLTPFRKKTDQAQSLAQKQLASW